MHLYSATLRYLHAGLLSQLAQVSGFPEPDAPAYAATAVAALVQQVALPTDADESNARWDMCRQLYLSQLLTNHEELLRTDLGWPDRRRYLAEKMLGSTQVAAMSAGTTQPAAAVTLLGFLTILLLAVVGEHASQANLNPTALGQWLQQQTATPDAFAPASQPAVKASKEAVPAKSKAAAKAPAAAPALAPAARTRKSSRTLVLGLGCVALMGVGGYFVVGKSDASPVTAPVAAAVAPAAVPVPEPAPAPVTAAPAPVAEVAVSAAVPVVAATTKAAVAARPVLRDTMGNAAMAQSIGGRFNVAAGRYLKGEGQPLIIKLINRATLTVGINSTESLLYKRLVNPALPRPSDLVLDRLAFDNSHDRLGAEGAQQLGSVASLLKTFPKVRVLVLGHANPSETDATKLGLKRATVAVQELQKQGIDPNRLQAQGVLATGLPTDNDPPERQAMLQGISLKISKL